MANVIIVLLIVVSNVICVILGYELRGRAQQGRGIIESMKPPKAPPAPDEYLPKKFGGNDE